MTETISLRDANQRFGQLMRAVEGGTEFVVTRRGRPIARIVPTRDSTSSLTPEQEAAWRRTLQRAQRGWRSDGAAFDRAELHDR